MKISEKNRALYQLYLDSNYAVNSSTKNTTYRTYRNSMLYFMEFLHTKVSFTLGRFACVIVLVLLPPVCPLAPEPEVESKNLPSIFCQVVPR